MRVPHFGVGIPSVTARQGPPYTRFHTHTYTPLCLYWGTTWSISWRAGQLKTNQAAQSTLVMGKPRLWRKWGWLMDIFTLWHNCLPQASITPGDNPHLLSRPTPMQPCQTYSRVCKCLHRWWWAQSGRPGHSTTGYTGLTFVWGVVRCFFSQWDIRDCFWSRRMCWLSALEMQLEYCYCCNYW